LRCDPRVSFERGETRILLQLRLASDQKLMLRLPLAHSLEGVLETVTVGFRAAQCGLELPPMFALAFQQRGVPIAMPLGFVAQRAIPTDLRVLGTRRVEGGSKTGDQQIAASVRIRTDPSTQRRPFLFASLDRILDRRACAVRHAGLAEQSLDSIEHAYEFQQPIRVADQRL
jgi:hypothetical protein